MKTNISSLLFALAIVIAAIFLGNAYSDRFETEGEISVTGLGKADFTSDLIVWEGRFNAENFDLKQAYLTLAEEKATIEAYLTEKGVATENLVFSAVNTNPRHKTIYSASGSYMGEEFTGYLLTQSVSIESQEVEKIEKISREITELLNQGVQFYSESPRYYYTQLADLKIEMISKATEDARIRAEQIAQNSGAELDDLISAKMGVFQITGQNSKEDYSWGGTFNTSSKEKTASITMKLVYSVED
jgi:hypothetical protein